MAATGAVTFRTAGWPLKREMTWVASWGTVGVQVNDVTMPGTVRTENSSGVSSFLASS